MINEKAETSVTGLYVAGEVCAGVHGANRLSGNALTELWVFGAIAGRETSLSAKKNAPVLDANDLVSAEIERLQEMVSRRNGESFGSLHQALRDAMWRGAGLIRNAGSLKVTIGELEHLKERWRGVSAGNGMELQRVLKLGNMLAVSEMICQAALYRTESRGAHCRQDWPEKNDSWLSNVLLNKQDDRMVLNTKPVQMTKLLP